MTFTSSGGFDGAEKNAFLLVLRVRSHHTLSSLQEYCFSVLFCQFSPNLKILQRMALLFSNVFGVWIVQFWTRPAGIKV